MTVDLINFRFKEHGSAMLANWLSEHGVETAADLYREMPSQIEVSQGHPVGRKALAQLMEIIAEHGLPRLPMYRRETVEDPDLLPGKQVDLLKGDIEGLRGALTTIKALCAGNEPDALEAIAEAADMALDGFRFGERWEERMTTKAKP